MSRRGVAPVIGVVLLVLLTIVLATVVGAMALGVGGQTQNAPEAAITADMETGAQYGNPKIVLTHRSGDPIDVRDLTVRVFVEGQPLADQPDVPFFSEDGFISGPDGPFNSKTADKIWTAGENASLTIAGTNSPQATDASRVTIRFYIDGEAVSRARV